MDNLSLDVLINFVLIKKKECIEEVKEIFGVLGLEVDWSDSINEINENIKLEIVFEMIDNENEELIDVYVNDNISEKNYDDTSGQITGESFGNNRQIIIYGSSRVPVVVWGGVGGVGGWCKVIIVSNPTRLRLGFG